MQKGSMKVHSGSSQYDLDSTQMTRIMISNLMSEIGLLIP